MKRMMSVSLVCGLLMSSVSAEEKPSEVLDAAIKAAGGAEALGKVKAMKREYSGKIAVMGADVEFTAAAIDAFPGKSRATIDLSVGGTAIKVLQVLNGDKVKMSVSVGGTDMSPPIDDNTKEELRQSTLLEEIFLLVSLRDAKRFEVQVIDGVKVDGKETVGLLIAPKSAKGVKVYFDKKSMLMVRMERRGLSSESKQIDQVYTMSNYKKFDGIERPTRLKVTHDGKDYLDATVKSYEHLEKVDEKFSTDD